MTLSMLMVAGVLLAGIEATRAGFDQICSDAVSSAQAQFAKDQILPEEVSVSLYEIHRSENTWTRGGYRSEAQMYPASVVKVFYLAYAAHLMDTGRLESSPEFERAAEDMIRVSSNDATGYMIDKICNTTPGPEIGEDALKEFGEKRRAVNYWFESLGYKGVNAVQRTYNEGPYGREAQWLGEKFSNRNSLSSQACAQLLADIALEKHWSHDRSLWMKNLLARANPQDDPARTDGQARAYTGRVIPSGTKLYSKAGWTSDTRHDVAWLMMPDGREFSISIFTRRGNNLQLVSYIASQILNSLGYKTEPPVGDPILDPVD